jgi:tRNA(Ile)-lysidine synthase
VTCPDAALTARFRQDVERLAGPLGARRLALAVSGGPDSMAMLALANAAWPGQVIAAMVDHGLRAESSGEARMVTDHCAALGVPHATLAIGEARPVTGNLHAWARTRRYALLHDRAAEQGCAFLLTAHHADDQAETFLMRAARGSGVAGLAAIRAHVAGKVATLRPLLGWRRAELRDVAAGTGAPFVDDPSNRDTVFERARVRDLIERTGWLDAPALANAAMHAAEADAALGELTAMFWDQRAVLTAGVLLDMASLPREIRRRLVRRAIRHVQPGGGRDNIEALLDSLEAGKTATHGDVIASAKGEIWRFAPAPPRRSH